MPRKSGRLGGVAVSVVLYVKQKLKDPLEKRRDYISFDYLLLLFPSVLLVHIVLYSGHDLNSVLIYTSIYYPFPSCSKNLRSFCSTKQATWLAAFVAGLFRVCQVYNRFDLTNRIAVFVDRKYTDTLIFIFAADAQPGFRLCRIRAKRMDVADMKLFLWNRKECEIDW